MVAPDSQAPACPLSGRNSTYRPVKKSETGSHLHNIFKKLGVPNRTTLVAVSIGRSLAEQYEVPSYIPEHLAALLEQLVEPPAGKRDNPNLGVSYSTPGKGPSEC
jgi:hypothetical protein